MDGRKGRGGEGVVGWKIVRTTLMGGLMHGWVNDGWTDGWMGGLCEVGWIELCGWIAGRWTSGWMDEYGSMAGWFLSLKTLSVSGTLISFSSLAGWVDVHMFSQLNRVDVKQVAGWTNRDVIDACDPLP